MQKIMTEQEELIWLAGILEGEGYFGSHKGCSVIQLHMTDEDVVEHAGHILRRLTGKPIAMEAAPARKAEYLTAFRVGVYGTAADDVMRLLVGYMSERRRSVIGAVLERRKLIKKIDLVALGLSRASTRDDPKSEPVVE